MNIFYINLRAKLAKWQLSIFSRRRSRNTHYNVQYCNII